MKIYFTGSISNATEEVRENYRIIKKYLEEMGNVVFIDHILNVTKDDLKKQNSKQSTQIQGKMAKRKKQADLIIAETSFASFGVGQEISYGLDNNKQVLALHLPGRKPHLIRNENGDLLYVAEYTRDNLKEVLTDYIEISKDRMDVRFNFFVSPKIVNYLDFVSKKRKIPRAVYLRGLIKKDMDEIEFE